jgi:hypothetical protein
MENHQKELEVNNARQDAAVVYADVKLVRVQARGLEKNLRSLQCAKVLFSKSC